MSGVHTVHTDDAPQAIGPYSQAVVADGWVFCAGQIPIDPGTGELIRGDVGLQTERVIENLKAVLAASGSSLSHVVKTTVYLVDMDEFQAMNAVYGRYFGDRPPARAAVEVRRLPRDVRVEIECVARLAATCSGAA
jgi:2-iminobutanoate/2-iminopropanoate deaminase